MTQRPCDPEQVKVSWEPSPLTRVAKYERAYSTRNDEETPTFRKVGASVLSRRAKQEELGVSSGKVPLRTVDTETLGP